MKLALLLLSVLSVVSALVHGQSVLRLSKLPALGAIEPARVDVVRLNVPVDLRQSPLAKGLGANGAEVVCASPDDARLDDGP